MMEESQTLRKAHAALRARRWRAAYAQLRAADAAQGLDPEDRAELAAAAYLLGHETEAVGAWACAHDAEAGRGNREAAARCGFWLGLVLLLRGQLAHSAGWLARTERVLGVSDANSPHAANAAEAYATLLRALHALFSGNLDAAETSLVALCASAERTTSDVCALSVLALGQTRIARRETAAGLASLDEAMTLVLSGDLSPIVAGVIYCAVILCCRRTLDLRRAREWTVALSEWCASQPELVAFRGQCLVHRSEVLQWQGDWLEAAAEAERACRELEARSEAGVGRAYYQRAGLHRLRGELAVAEQLYATAASRGCEPQPGLSLLRMLQGDLASAAATMRRAVDEIGGERTPSGDQSAEMLLAAVEVLLAADDIEMARRAEESLARLAATLDAPLAHASAATARGAVLLQAGEPMQALRVLREAWMRWQQQGASYEAARTRVLIARACCALGDEDTAETHRAAARAVFERLGAVPALTELEGSGMSGNSSALTEREREVLALVASGATNREVAEALAISPHTVARHLSNIFAKLDVSSRTAASAIAFERHWV